MKSPITWIAIVDNGHARTVEHSGHDLTPVPEFSFDAIKMRDRDVSAERPGRVHESHGPGRSAVEPHITPKELAARAFIDFIVDGLDRASDEGRFDRLILIAAPKALGLLREKLTPALRAKVIGELSKDLANLPLRDLKSHLSDLLHV